MAEVTDTPEAPEPSMEEILASIRKIIADDNVPVAEVPVPAPPPVAAPVVELTHMLADDGTVVDLAAKEKLSEVDIDLDDSDSVVEEVVDVPDQKDSGELISAPAEEAAVSSMAALASTVEIERLASAPQSGSYLGNGSRTLEDMVVELMRPLLKDWLDKNLPTIVDRIVQKEVERISSRAKS